MTAQPSHQSFDTACAVGTLSLQEKLRANDIEPLDPKEVEAYMERERRAVPYTWGARVLGPLLTLVYADPNRVARWLVISGFFGLSVMSAVTVYEFFLDSSPWWATFVFLLGMSLSIFAVLTFFALTYMSYQIIDIRMPAQWVQAEPENVHELLEKAPPEIQDMATSIRMFCGSAQLVVHELRQDGTVFDPVLEVVDGDERAYVAIWNGDVVVKYQQID